MAYCNNCGTQLAEGVKFCPKCGTATGAVAVQEPPQPETATPQAEPVQEATEQQQLSQAKQEFEKKFANVMNSTADTTAEFDPKDIEATKVLALFSYLGFFVLIPILAAKGSKFARFHANQGLVLFIACILYSVAANILTSILLAISWRLGFVSSLLGLVGVLFFILAVMGIINSLNGKAKELPVIGKYRILK